MWCASPRSARARGSPERARERDRPARNASCPCPAATCARGRSAHHAGRLGYLVGMAAAPSALSSSAPVRPRLRGVLHEYAFFVSVPCGAGLILAASGGRARVAAGIYAGAVSALLGTSALYHRVTWRPAARRWMRRLDHSMIFVLIAGTYTPVALLALKGTLADVILIVLWAGALGGIVFKLLWIDAPKWLFAAVYVAF